MNVWYLVLMLLAVVFLAMAATGMVTRRINFLALGLFFWALVPLFHFMNKL